MTCTGASALATVTTIYARGGTKVRVVHCPDCAKALKGVGAWNPSFATVPRHKSA